MQNILKDLKTVLKFIWIPIVLQIGIVVVIGCYFILGDPVKEPYPFPNQDIPIKTITIIHNRNTNFGEDGDRIVDMQNLYILRELDPSEFDGFMKKLMQLNSKETGLPPPIGYGEFLVRVVYSNGDIEIFGDRSIAYIECGDEGNGIGLHYFPDDDFEDLFFEYAGRAGQGLR